MGDQYNVNDTVTVERGTVARRGYTFGSWNTASDGSGTSYEPGDTFTITEATTLYAQWIPNGNTKYIVEHYLETAAGSGEYTSAAREQKSGSTDSEVSATPNTYEGYEYNAAKSRATGIIAADGSLVLELYYDKLPTYGVTYEYATPGLPGAVADTIPSDDGMYLAGASVTAKSPSQTSVTVEENGVVIGTWSFNGWDEASKNMAEGGITFTGTWTYTETGKARVTHVYSGELPDAVMATLPTDSNEYYIGAPVTPTAPTSTTVTITNADGIVTDTYTFGGWDKQSDTMVSGGVTFTGTWTHTKTAQAGVQYVYSTPGLPGEVTATRPTDANLYYIGTAVNAQNPSSTSVDIVKNGVTVGTWTFGGWDKPSDTMVSGGITFTGTWTYEAATEYGVSYQYVAAEGTLPDAISTSGGAYAVSDSTTYLVNATVTRKNDVPVGTAYDVMENGVKTGTWTLTSWNADSAKMTDQGVTFTGTWTYKAAKQYTLTYVVDGNTVQTETLYAGQTVPSYEYTPDEAYLEFRGWYSNSGCTDSTTVPGTMPSDNLTVYGKTIYKTYEYTINYYYQNENGTSYTQDTSATRTDSAPYNTKISTVDPIGGMKTGFVFGHTSPASGSITIGTGSNVLNVYYDRGQYAYTIEYYYDNELDENATVTDTAAFRSRDFLYRKKQNRASGLITLPHRPSRLEPARTLFASTMSRIPLVIPSITTMMASLIPPRQSV